MPGIKVHDRSEEVETEGGAEGDEDETGIGDEKITEPTARGVRG